ncbi:hypothetical protein F3157_05390 [Virgibacillus dakarensis]|uniref:hypothetical protein n=1 Tax=Virgibacillus dakarensis TaxID=1917889 RepID=UPI000B43ED5B|nr:hypothetical protein [Virgibacillus dakarensis]MTW85091.1 hypothetical protein [Virgibacillus dakarensis]
MNITDQSQKLLDAHYSGKMSIRQFLHALNRLITVRTEEPTIIDDLGDGQRLIQTTDAKLIPKIIDSDAKIIAKSYDDNGFINKVRAIVSEGEDVL